MNGKNRIKKIAVIRLDKVGDLILTTPAITLLRDSFPSATISAIVSPYTKEVLEGNPSIDEFFTVGPVSHAEPFSIISAFTAGRLLRNKKFDLTIVFSPHTNAYVLAFGLGSPRRVGYTYASRRFTRVLGSFLLTDWVNEPPDQIAAEEQNIAVPHEIEQNVALVSHVSQLNHAVIPDPVLAITKEDEKFRGDFFKNNDIQPDVPVLGFHLSIRWRQSVTNDIMGNFIRDITEAWKGAVLITSGPGEKQWIKELYPVFDYINKKHNDIFCGTKIVVAESLSLKQWAALIKSCSVLISPDTGSLHVASAMKVPVIAVMEERFFKYHSKRWAPWGVPYRIVKKPKKIIFEQFVCDVELALKQLALDMQRSNYKCQIK